jgi:hypothetical protein
MCFINFYIYRSNISKFVNNGNFVLGFAAKFRATGAINAAPEPHRNTIGPTAARHWDR